MAMKESGCDGEHESGGSGSSGSGSAGSEVVRREAANSGRVSREDGDFHGFVAESYDRWMPGGRVSPEYLLYKRHIVDNGGAALELGCGTGRLLLEYIADGLDVDGVDYSPDMLRICRDKAHRMRLAPNLYEQPMQALDLARKYRTLYIPTNSFMLLAKREDAMNALHRFYAHLEHDGELLLSVTIPWEHIRDAARCDWRELARTMDAEGNVVVLSERVELDIWEQLKTNENLYEVFDKEGKPIATHRDTIHVRWYGKHEIELVLREAGFRCVAVSGGAKENSSMIISARK